MFKKRRKDGAGLAPLPPTTQQYLHRRVGSDSNPTTTSATPVANPTSLFDFDLPAPTFTQDDRPRTSDGFTPRQGSITPDPPVLPPIERVSSQRVSTLFNLSELAGTFGQTEFSKGDAQQQHGDRVGKAADESSMVQSSPPQAAGRDVASLSTPPHIPTKSQNRGSPPPDGSGRPKMQSSLFPMKTPSPPPHINTDLPMSRAFIDARDKPYGPPPPRPQLHTTNSSPDLRSAPRPPTAGSLGSSPVSAVAASRNPRPFPQQSFSTGNMNALIRPPSNAATNYSGTTARSNQSSKSTAMGSDAPTLTIGTPYSNTSSSFPLPQHVATRPKTAGGTATIGGVDVPTHHTSALPNRIDPSIKANKRKTKLLNPMNLLSRRRPGQEDESLAIARAEQAQALERQRNVAARGMKNLPEDYDPRIRGKVVHDFSAPRHSRRMFSYNDALDPDSDAPGGSKWLQSANSAPFVPTLQDGENDRRYFSEGSPRRSVHSPIFVEHFSEHSLQQPDTSAAAIQAERLENKAFLNRTSHIAQDSAGLPPFGRKNPQIDSVQPSYLNEEYSSTDVPLPAGREQQRDSHVSTASSGISPITQRNSAVGGAVDVLRQSMSSGVSPITSRNSALPGTLDPTGQNLSPVSPTASDRYGLSSFPRPGSRPVSEVSRLGSSDGLRPISALSSGSGARERSSSDANGRHVSMQPAIEPIAEEQTPKIGNGFIPMPERAPPAAPEVQDADPSNPQGFIIPPRTSSAATGSAISTPGISSPLPTPETENVDALATTASSSSNLAQKRADAAGHTKRMSSSGKPKHHVSNASRFSFQFGGSAAEELALEEKARKLGSQPQPGAVSGSPGDEYDEDDYFDEDAMDDMDEMEVQAQHENELTAMLTMPPAPVSPLTPTFMPMSTARQQLQLDDDSDGISEPDSDDEAPYWMHDDFRSYTHTRDPSALDGTANAAAHQRSMSGGGKLTLNTNLLPNGGGFYMHPQAAGYSPVVNQSLAAQKPPLPHRDSGNSEHNRIASGLTFGAEDDAATSKHKTVNSKSTIGSVDEMTNPSANHSSTDASGSTSGTGLGLTGFSGFKFTDTPDASRPTSLDAHQKKKLNRRGDSETLPQTATFVANAGLAKSSLDQHAMEDPMHFHDNQYDIDDMYFDDGGFEPDVNERDVRGTAVDEDAFDDDAFLDQTNRMARYDQTGQQNGERELEPAIVAADGPYPAFARPISARMRERDSQMLLEDLPLQEPAVDPKLVPRRNPSEDAKRLGLTDKVPPLPAIKGLSSDSSGTQLQAYHASLADAANKAFAEGRFLRAPSTSTTRSVSEYAKGDDDKALPVLGEELSQYSRNEDEDQVHSLNGNSIATRRAMTNAPNGNLDPGVYPSPPKLSFDFGFENAIMDDSIMGDDFDGEGDDDIVAAANAEALANDDDGFYGQEFGFYAKARPNSGEVQAINGGFFGMDGDDGLSRQKSLKEPNLTPITERSEFSTRNSFIGGPFSPYTPSGARLSVSHWVENEVTTFDQLRKLKASAFGGSNASLHSDGSGGGLHMAGGASAPVSARSSSAPQGYFGAFAGGAPMTFGYSTDSSASSNPSSAHPHPHPQPVLPFHESPHSAASGGAFPVDLDATPKRPAATTSTAADVPVSGAVPTRRISDKLGGRAAHSRTSSGADSVTYVREQDPDGSRPPRWVLEKRRTSEAGQLELVAREVVQDGWI